MAYGNSAQLVGQIQSDMHAAMKDRNTAKVSVLKALLARFSNEEAITPTAPAVTSEAGIAGAEQGVGSTEAARKELSLADHQRIIQDEITEMQQVLDQLSQPSDYKSELEQKISILQNYL